MSAPKPPGDGPPPTSVPWAEYVALAQLAARTRAAQQRFFRARHSPGAAELFQEALRWEYTLDRAVKEVLARASFIPDLFMERPATDTHRDWLRDALARHGLDTVPADRFPEPAGPRPEGGER